MAAMFADTYAGFVPNALRDLGQASFAQLPPNSTTTIARYEDCRDDFEPSSSRGPAKVSSRFRVVFGRGLHLVVS